MNDVPQQRPPATPALDVRFLAYAYDRTLALKSISFTVAPRSIHGFVGPNGSGKTTTLKILATLLKPHWGTALAFGRDLYAESEQVRGRIGYMPDIFSLYRQMTVFESLDFFAAAHGIPLASRDPIIEDLLALTDMGSHRHHQLRRLSRGMLQRMSLACALVHDPDLLLLDEPASNLDPRARVELMEVLKALSRMGKTIFISSHILSELADLCDAVTIIDRGWTKYSGTMPDLLATGMGRPRYELRLAAEHPPVETALRGVAGVDDVTKAEGAPLYRLSFDPERTDTNAILCAVMASGAMVASFRPNVRALGEAFMELTQPGVPS